MYRRIPLSGLREEVENASANQGLGRPFFVFDRPKNTNFVEDVDILLPMKFRLIPLEVSEKKLKMWEVNDEGRQTSDDRQRVVTIVHLRLRLMCTKILNQNDIIFCVV